MARTGFNDEWEDDEPIGVVYSEHRRRWVRGRNNYFVMMLGVVALFLVIGSVGYFAPLRLAGAAGVGAAAYAVWRSDKAAATSVPRELGWLAAGAVLAAGGLFLYAAS